jgi:heptosyltransferase-2
MSAAALRRMIVRAPNWLGDAVLSLCALRDLRRQFADARIEVVARPWVAELYRAVREIDDVRSASRFAEFVDAARGFDAAVLLPNSFGSALAMYLARVPERWGYDTDGRGFLLTRAARVPAALQGESEAFYYRALLAGVGWKVSGALDAALRCPQEWGLCSKQLLEGRRDWIGLNPGAFYGAAKRWLPERYAALGDILAQRLASGVVILGSAAERPLGEGIAARMRAETRVLCGRTSLAELCGVLSSLKLLLTNDSGPMHVAAALGTPLVALFGPTNWKETAPFGRRVRLAREPVECAPCKKRECPIDHRCMRRLTVERVLAAVDSLFKEMSDSEVEAC